VRLAERAVADRPHDYARLNTLGGVLLRAGRTKEAIARLQQALERRPSGDQVGDELLLALAYQRLGRAEEARRWLNQARAWFERGQAPVRASSLAAAGASGPLPLLPSLGGEVPDPRARALGWETWLELQLLRREVEALLKAPQP
jgi:tetratricopeptide (TPR) repeat protein